MSCGYAEWLSSPWAWLVLWRFTSWYSQYILLFIEVDNKAVLSLSGVLGKYGSFLGNNCVILGWLSENMTFKYKSDVVIILQF